ncbi:hypothetical protein N473_08670 [Pseudoalteromonas luteoviolacea CPMOR-1]|uniref:Uncharacterized protein n=2 Tax=Pseudoalteromonas luteoviolacea TaxID=43657 RepID=A0A167MI82_9GAMM|nr:hypothetical protein N473_08670 [Pseudoalteromonas luteoviolacea CPMOR-1]
MRLGNKMRVFVLVLVFFLSLDVGANNTQRLAFTDCWFSVAFNEDWQVTSKPVKRNKCKLEAKHKNSSANLSISVGYSEYLQVLSEHGFDYFNQQWVTVGRQGATESAEPVKFKHWQGLKGTVAVGCHDDGGYIGICPHDVLVLRESSMRDGNVLIIKSFSETEMDFSDIYNTLEAAY